MPPDLIAVFTGAKGRIPYAVKLAKNYGHSNIFITGVHGKNSVETLLEPLKLSPSFKPDLLEIDHTAKNTMENVTALFGYLEKHENLRKVLIVSHDYHLVRIKLLMPSGKGKYHFYYSGVREKYDNIRNINIVLSEVYKSIYYSVSWVADYAKVLVGKIRRI